MTEPPGRLTDDAARSLTFDSQPWLSCDECFDTVDLRVEELLAQATSFPERFRRHLLGCSACHEEARSLVLLVAGDFGLHPDPALARFEWATR